MNVLCGLQEKMCPLLGLLVYVGLRLCIIFSVGVRDTECLCAAATGTFVYAVNASGLVQHYSNSHSGDVRKGNL